MSERAIDRVAIIGLGLIGGSLARDLAALGVRVSAYDADATRLDAAIDAKVVDSALDATLAGASTADVIVIAVPVDAATDVLRRIAPHVGATALVTDVGSTKARIVEVANEIEIAPRFVGSHPMAGDHRSGWDASRTGLFGKSTVYLCPPTAATTDSVRRANVLWRMVGARPECMSAVEHDRKLAWTSHLPHMVSTSLALALANARVGRVQLGPGGRDTTRLAGGSPDMWTAIALENGPAIEAALEQTEREIEQFRNALKRADPAELRGRFLAAQAWFDE